MAIKTIIRQADRINGAVCFLCLLVNGSTAEFTMPEIVANMRARG